VKNTTDLVKYIKRLCFGCFTFLCFAVPPPLAAYEDAMPIQDLEGTLENTRLNEVVEQYLATMQWKIRV